MAQVGSLVTNKLAAMLASAGGVPETLSNLAMLAGIEAAGFNPNQVVTGNVAPEIADKTAGSVYPAVNVYCAKVVNLLREKFRTFSGEAHMIAEVRVSGDRLDGIEQTSQLYVDAVTAVLDAQRGDWGDGAFYGGGYEVNYGTVKQGGRNFLQIAKVSFVVQFSTN